MANELDSSRTYTSAEDAPSKLAPEIPVAESENARKTQDSVQPTGTVDSAAAATPPTIPPVTIVFSPPPSEPPADRVKWTDIAIVILTAGIVLAAIIQTIIFNKQWNEMHSAGEQTDKLIGAANKIQSALITANSQNLEAVKKTLEQNQTALKRTLGQSKQAMDASNKQSRDSLNASIESARLDQRPWITFDGFEMSEEPTLNKEVTVTLKVINTGKTPGLDLTSQSRLASWNVEPPPAVFVAPASAPSKGILAPGVTTVTFTTDPLSLTNSDQLDAYTSKQNRIYIEAIVRYSDAFGKSHWTKVCAYHASGMPLTTFQYCEHGNEIDTGEVTASIPNNEGTP